MVDNELSDNKYPDQHHAHLSLVVSTVKNIDLRRNTDIRCMKNLTYNAERRVKIDKCCVRITQLLFKSAAECVETAKQYIYAPITPELLSDIKTFAFMMMCRTYTLDNSFVFFTALFKYAFDREMSMVGEKSLEDTVSIMEYHADNAQYYAMVGLSVGTTPAVSVKF